MTADTIDAVVASLDGIVDRARRSGSRLGYFPALYRKVTLEVQRAIIAGEFDDAARMERFVVRFANRYLDAAARYEGGDKPTRSWQVSFDAVPRYWPIVLQHLLLSFNAHINLDLGIAAARTSPGPALVGLQPDFDRINQILASLVDDVKTELTQIWPLLRVLDGLMGSADDRIINFSMARARDSAWRLAEKLAPLPEPQQAEEIERIDELVATFGWVLWRPVAVRVVGGIIRLGERGSVRQIIDILD